MKLLAEGIYAWALTLWIGCLWSIGYVAAPTLFHAIADRALAGSVAGRLFTLTAYIGVGCAIYLASYRLAHFGRGCFAQGRFWVILAMLALTLVGEFGVQPILASLKREALPAQVMATVLRDRFATWHGVASGLYLIQSLLGAVLVWLHRRGVR